MCNWVKCSDKLPDDYNYVLVCAEQPNNPTDDWGKFSIASRIPDKGWQFIETAEKTVVCPLRGDMLDILSIDEITHWKELELPWEDEDE